MTKSKRAQQKTQTPFMQLLHNNPPDAILCADIHMRATSPRCRAETDVQYAEECLSKWEFIVNLGKYNDCPIFIAGDIGNSAQWPNWLLEAFITITKGNTIFAIPGQHDLPNHRIDLWKKSAVGVLHASGAINLIINSNQTSWYADLQVFGFPYGESIKKKGSKKDTVNIAIAHTMVLKSKPLWPGQEAPKGHELLKKFPEYNLILTGDNHNPFVVESRDGRLLVNPGSMTRHKADQINHRPRVYCWYADQNEVIPIYLPIKDGVVRRSHIDAIRIKDERRQEFIDKLSEDFEITNSFKQNLRNAIQELKPKPIVKKKIKDAAELSGK